MKICGRIIRNESISVNTENQFKGKYKEYTVSVERNSGVNSFLPTWTIEVIMPGVGDVLLCEDIQRCQIREVIVYVMNAICEYEKA